MHLLPTVGEYWLHFVNDWTISKLWTHSMLLTVFCNAAEIWGLNWELKNNGRESNNGSVWSCSWIERDNILFCWKWETVLGKLVCSSAVYCIWEAKHGKFFFQSYFLENIFSFLVFLLPNFCKKQDFFLKKLILLQILLLVICGRSLYPVGISPQQKWRVGQFI